LLCDQRNLLEGQVLLPSVSHPSRGVVCAWLLVS
jgi:hypothetical protein